MSRFQDSAVVELPFRIETISDVAAPDGSSSVWQQYTISQGPNTITGLRPGTRRDVEPQLETMVAHLNLRRMGKKVK